MWQKPFVVHKAWKYFWHGLLLGLLQPLTVGLEYLSFYLPLALWIDGVQPQTTNSDISIFPAGAPTCGVYSLGLDLRRTNLHLLFAWCHRQLEKERCMGWLWTQVVVLKSRRQSTGEEDLTDWHYELWKDGDLTFGLLWTLDICNQRQNKTYIPTSYFMCVCVCKRISLQKKL